MKKYFPLLVIALLSIGFSSAYAQVEITNAGIQGQGATRHILVVIKNTSKKPLKNVVVMYTEKIKLVKGAKQWESENTELAEVKNLKSGEMHEHKQLINEAVVQVLSLKFSSIVQR
jgi:hypothetical protein